MAKSKDLETPKKTRRGRNEGMIRYIESKKLYEARYAVGVNDKGNTIYKSIYGKKKTGPGGVLEKMRNALAALGKGEYVDPSDKTLLSWCKEWYEVYAMPNLKKGTRRKYDDSMKRLENLDIANMQLKYLSLELIQKAYNRMIDDYASETIKATHSLINGALKKAEEINLIIKNPARNVTIPKDDDDHKKEVKALTLEEYDKFMHEMAKRSHYYMFALFTSNTGLRPGEAIALSRSDITKEGCVKVTKTYDAKLKYLQNSTKTDSSKRTIPIPNDTLKLLKEYMLKQKNQKDDDPLFQTLAGTRLTARNVLRQFKSIGETVGCTWVNLHTMRHTFASRLFEKQIDIKVISKLLGHKSVSTTYDIYVHFINNIIEDSVQVLNSVNIPDNLPKKDLTRKKNVTELKKACTT